MADFRAHGGDCCGIFHFYGFGNTTLQMEQGLNALDSKLRDQNPYYQKRTIEIVLNHEQCLTGQATLLPALAERGFVMVSAFRNGNSRNKCYVFHRIDKRVRMNNLRFTWTGQVMSPSLGGEIPDIPTDVLSQGQPSLLGICPDVGVHLNYTHLDSTPTYYLIHVGDELAYHGSSQEHQRDIFILESRNLSHSHRVTVRKIVSGETHSMAINSFRFHRRPLPPAVDVVEHIPFPNQRFTETVENTPPAPPTVVATYFYNRYQSGTTGGLYETLERVIAQSPNCLTRMCKQIMSDGTTTDEEVEV